MSQRNHPQANAAQKPEGYCDGVGEFFVRSLHGSSICPREPLNTTHLLSEVL
jgi:hypothetical protein